ncbi:SMP-30/gluconolactonase/LRE family protein [Achromobacter insuavis]|uniref:SMP-30/gluconolactonase/LRE family protein n=1 Tax=Achromobacter insuavis TaxID=1287735 RepID=UPI001F13E00E|nr:SMP-30/gluconolactonase/LRE family protein [Achromobacter insuavis]
MLSIIPTEVHTAVPAHLRLNQETDWSRARGGGPLHSFLEGPGFDRQGRLYCVDVCHGRIFRIGRDGAWEVFASYGGRPNGLRIHRDGRVFVADALHGLLVFDPDTGRRIGELAQWAPGQRFSGLNDLAFADDGTVFFTDPGHSALEDPHGRVFAWQEGGAAAPVLQGLPFPNGVVVMPDQAALCVASTRSLEVLRATRRGVQVRNLGVYARFSGGLAGPDGLAVCEDGGLVVAHSGMGVVWWLDPLGEVRGRIESCAGIRNTNLAFDPDDPHTLYITESETGSILRARLPVKGRTPYSHR